MTIWLNIAKKNGLLKVRQHTYSNQFYELCLSINEDNLKYTYLVEHLVVTESLYTCWAQVDTEPDRDYQEEQ